MTPEEQRTAVEEQVLVLFSGNALTRGEMMSAAKVLAKAEGISSFHTSVPWKLSLPDGHTIPGTSYDLISAAQDIYAQLQALGDAYSMDTHVALSIDNTRFQEAVTTRPPVRKGGLGA